MAGPVGVGCTLDAGVNLSVHSLSNAFPHSRDAGMNLSTVLASANLPLPGAARYHSGHPSFDEIEQLCYTPVHDALPHQHRQHVALPALSHVLWCGLRSHVPFPPPPSHAPNLTRAASLRILYSG